MANRETPAWSAEVETLYRDRSRELWASFYAQCCDADRAFDALQEAFLRLQQQNGEVIRDKRAWLLQVGRNWLRDVARRSRVAAKPAEHLEDVPAPQAEPHSAFLREELYAQVRAGLTELKPDDREVLVMRYALGWSSQRIADTLEITPAAVDMRLLRARGRLAEVLKQSGVTDERV